MSLFILIQLLGAISLVSGAVLFPVRQLQSSSSSAVTCPVTVTQYVTITHVPPIVTIAVPNITSISQSLARASSIDSIVVVEQSQDAPASGPANTAVPTFINTIVASAYEATEVPGTGSTVIYVSVGPNTTNWSYTPTESVVIGVTTISVVPEAATETDSAITSQSVISITTTLHMSFTNPTSGWNDSNANATQVSPLLSPGISTNGSLSASASALSTSTDTTYIATTTEEISITVTAAPSVGSGYGSDPFPTLIIWPTSEKRVEKRQTCVMISADVGNHQTASWCNNWDGHTTLSYTSWETTITPGNAGNSASSTVSPVAQSPSSTPTDVTQSTATLQATGPATTVSQTLVSVASSSTGSMTSSANPATTSCGQTGAFDISFDDLPEQSVFSNETASLPPIFNPFDHFYWAPGWSYGPPPFQPYTPHNGDQLAIFDLSLIDGVSGSPDAGSIPTGGFSAGPRKSLDQYWFNATSAWVGCQNNITSPTGSCDFVAEGYKWDNDAQKERLVVTQHFAQPLCLAVHCNFQQINFNEAFTGLSTIAFYANIAGILRNFYMDDLQMGWWNNTCDAGLMRIGSRK